MFSQAILSKSENNPTAEIKDVKNINPKRITHPAVPLAMPPRKVPDVGRPEERGLLKKGEEEETAAAAAELATVPVGKEGV